MSGRLPPTPAPLSRELFSVLSGLVEERTGLHYRIDDAPLFGDKVRARATEAGFESLLDYYYFLRYDAASSAELEALFEALYVHETYFFREAPALTVGITHVVQKALDAKPHVRPRIWSAACSTGEEPFTLAMMLDERGLLGAVDIVGTDVSPKAVAHARRGMYGGRALRALPAAAREKWFREVDGRLEIDARLRSAVDWKDVNLLDAKAVVALGTFDLILCRNVLIYFDDATISSVVQRLAERLRAQGKLAVGASESLLRFGSLLQCEELGGSFFYAMPEDAGVSGASVRPVPS